MIGCGTSMEICWVLGSLDLKRPAIDGRMLFLGTSDNVILGFIYKIDKTILIKQQKMNFRNAKNTVCKNATLRVCK